MNAAFFLEHFSFYRRFHEIFFFYFFQANLGIFDKNLLFEQKVFRLHLCVLLVVLAYLILLLLIYLTNWSHLIVSIDRIIRLVLVIRLWSWNTLLLWWLLLLRRLWWHLCLHLLLRLIHLRHRLQMLKHQNHKFIHRRFVQNL